MKKRVVTFLSLFSLAMVLSVYYVMLPTGVKSPTKTNPVNNIIENADDPYIEGIILERTSGLKEELQVQLDIMESSDYSATEKLDAASRIEQIEYIIDLENEMRTSIKELGFPSAYVEWKISDVDVLAVSETKSRQDALKIIECIDTFFDDSDFHQVNVYFR